MKSDWTEPNNLVPVLALRKSISKKIQRYLKHRNIHLWGAPGVRHMLVGAPVPNVELCDSPISSDEKLIHRIIETYHRTLEAYPQDYLCWDEVSELRTALEGRDHSKVKNLLEVMFKNSVVHHFGHHEGMYRGRRVWRAGYQELRVSDMLLSLGEALGILNVPNHAHMKTDAYLRFINSDQNKLFSAIQEALGFSLEVPMVGCPPSFVFDGVHTSADMIRHAYIVHQIKNLGVEYNEAILEIGAGYGSQPYLAYKAGYRDYTIIDLPVVNAIQMFFLGSTLGTDVVSGFGEKDREIKVLPTEAINSLPDESISLVSNMDSMAEWEQHVIKGYLENVKRLSKRFLHINQEAEAFDPVTQWKHSTVQALVSEVGGLKRVYRYPYWMLEGYVEEMYSIRK